MKLISQEDHPTALRFFDRRPNEEATPSLRIVFRGKELYTIFDYPEARRILKINYPSIDIKNYNRPLAIRSSHTLRQVCRRVWRVLVREGLIDEYFGLSTTADYDGLADKKFFEIQEGYRWVACYPVTGGSEGHYIHVDLVGSPSVPKEPGKVVHLITGKTFLGMKHAARIALRCAELLGS